MFLILLVGPFFLYKLCVMKILLILRQTTATYTRSRLTVYWLYGWCRSSVSGSWQIKSYLFISRLRFPRKGMIHDCVHCLMYINMTSLYTYWLVILKPEPDVLTINLIVQGRQTFLLGLGVIPTLPSRCMYLERYEHVSAV